MLQPLPAACRDMAVSDLDAVTAIEVAAYSHPWSRGNFVDSLAAGYVARVAVGPDGALRGYYVAMPGVDELHLLNVTVAPAWQRRGLGTALMAEVAAQARRLALPTLWLEVRRSNEGARALYRRLGYAEVGTRRGYYPAAVGREDAVVMRLALPPQGSVHGLD